MRESPVISVVIPVFNVKQYLNDCISSLLSQTLEEVEFIFADDCSDDGSSYIIKEAARTDERIKYIRMERNLGAFAARKAGVLAANAPFVTFVDPDDTLSPDACRLFTDKLTETGADMVHGFAEIVNSNNLPEERLEFVRKAVRPAFGSLTGREILSALAVTGKINPTLWGKAYRTEIVMRALDMVPDGEYRRANDLLANFAICCLAQKYVSFDGYVYNYCYGQGGFGAAEQNLEYYKSVCRQVDVIPAMSVVAEKYFAGDVEVYDAFQAVESRLVGGCFSRIATMPEQMEDRRAAFDFLLERTGGVRLATVLAQRNYLRREDFSAELDAIGAIYPVPPRKIRKIGVFYHRLTPGGIQRVIASLVPVFRKLGHKVVVFLEREVSDSCYDLPSDVKIVYLPAITASNRAQIGNRLAKLAAALEEYGIDMMYYHACLGPNLLWDMLVCKWERRIQVIIHYHTSVCFVPRMSASYTRWPGYMKMLSFSDGVIALSQADALFLRICGVPAKYIPNPVSADIVAASHGIMSGRRTILWIARFSREKNPSDPVKILAKVRTKIPDARLVVVGGGPESFLKAVKSTIAALGLEDAVFLAGEQKDVRPYYEKSSLYLHTSNLEGFPMAILEAAASGLPIVMYALPWLELVRGNEGVIQTPQSDLDAAAAAIVTVFSSPVRAAAMSRANLRRSAVFASFDITAEWRSILSDLEEGRLFAAGNAQSTDGNLEALVAEFMHCYNRGISEMQIVDAARECERKRLSARVAQLEADNMKLKDVVAKKTAELSASLKQRGVVWANREDLKRKFDAVLKRSAACEDELRRWKCKIASLSRESSALKSSEAYRVGMFVTWPARKAWGGVKCLRENGAAYTVKHAVGKVLRKFGSKCKW